ncbi:SpaA isopeptide-forming pilin-related protein [Bifidobacterium sp. SO4]|uniref:SpaA isopeptide-forming pilin-related protein n=1 Tax=Bifidobacterium sp. SO4 TaxID=2809030 RepID=UPI001BDCE79B|nr:SpaA isopeptide-forming pilin-related protein [Bifidobacterium sp. SO4]MBT1170976.1 LPXTG cell wall anchor domain-containing protein [Bifidobacterium sp. SO4]
MMKFRKVMAGLAAAATLFAGMAFGAGTANAADAADALSDTQIRITASNADQFKTSVGIRQFKYAKLADYNFDGNGKPYLTTTNGVSKDTVKGALTAAGMTPADSPDDPFTWLGSQSVSTISGTDWRKFVENQTLRGLATNSITPDVSADGKTLTFDFAVDKVTAGQPSGRGLYLIIDQSGDYTIDNASTDSKCTFVYKQMQAILIGTKLSGVENGSGELNIQGIVFGDLATGTAEQKQTGTESCVPQGGFTKVGDDGTTGLRGAEFSVYTPKAGATDDDFKNGALSATPSIPTDKFDAYDEFGSTDQKTNILTSDQNGHVDFGTLPAGTYYVYESKMPTVADNSGKQYLTDFRAVLKVEVTAGESGKSGTFTITDLNDHGLLTGDATNGYKYRNITSIVHLPLTGAAGTALFAVVAVLLAAGAGVTFVRSRSVKRALR